MEGMAKKRWSVKAGREMAGGDQERKGVAVEGKGQRGLGKENVGGCFPT